MSNPANILDKYNSYSYYHVLIACDSTDAAATLSTSSDITDFQHDPQSAKFTPRKSGNGNYVVIINGSTDSEFVMNGVKWGTMMAPNGKHKGIKQYTTFAVDGELEITEPLGVRFLNTLANVGKTLKTDPNALIYMLKTVFVGHTTSGSSGYEQVKPLLFVPFDLVARVDHTGAIYTLSIMGVNDGAGKLPQISRMAEGISVSTPSDGKISVKEFLENNVTDRLNEKYKEFRTKLSEDTRAAGLDVPIDKFTEVRIEIKVDDGYEDKETYAVGSNTITQTQSNGTGDTILPLGENPTIEHMIDQIMMSSEGVLNDGKEKDDGSFYIYKISSTIESTPAAQNLTKGFEPQGVRGLYKVVYRVWRMKAIVQEISDPDDTSQDPKPGEFIEWDYIFTGKNVDVLDFNIKMEMGMAFFQTLTSSQNVVSQSGYIGAVTEQPTTTVGSPTKSNPQIDYNFNTPLFPGTNIKETLLRNKKFPLKTTSYDALLARHAAYENMGVVIKIRGNPVLLSEQIVSPEEYSSGVLDGSVAPGESPGLSKWTTTPGRAKLNIRMPSDNSTQFQSTEQFWYEGFYLILSVNNVFQDGEFTQEIELYPIIISDEIQTKAQDIPEAETPAPTVNVKDESKAIDPRAKGETVEGTSPTIEDTNIATTAQDRIDLKKSTQ